MCFEWCQVLSVSVVVGQCRYEDSLHKVQPLRRESAILTLKPVAQPSRRAVVCPMFTLSTQIHTEATMRPISARDTPYKLRWLVYINMPRRSACQKEDIVVDLMWKVGKGGLLGSVQSGRQGQWKFSHTAHV